MVSHDHQFIFLKTRKTAGTSIEMYLEPFCTPEHHQVVEQTHTLISPHGVVGRRLLPRAQDKSDPDNTWYHHMTAQAVRKNLGWFKWRRYLKISALRNPFDMMVSKFHYRQRGVDLPGDIKSHRAAFKTFLQTADWKTDDPILMLNGQPIANMVLLRFESLNDDLERLARRLKLDTTQTRLPMTKSSGKKRKLFTVADYYDREAVDLVTTKLSWYFDLGGYARQPEAA